MFSPSKLFALAALASSLVMNVSGHFLIAATQADADSLARSDVTKGSTTKCTSTLGGAATIANGVVSLVGKNFNGGGDGSTFITAGLSTTGATGKFSPVTVTTNGDKAPTAVGSVPLAVDLGGADCSAGQCVLAMASTANFGNCVALAASGSGAAAGTTTAAADTTTTAAADTTAAATTTAAAGTTTTAAATKHHHHKVAGGAAGAGAAAKAAKAAAKAGGAAGAAGFKAVRPHPRAWFHVEVPAQ